MALAKRAYTLMIKVIKLFSFVIVKSYKRKRNHVLEKTVEITHLTAHAPTASLIFPNCAVPENIHTPPTEGIGISWGVGGSARPKNLKKSMKLNWNFQRGWGVLEKIPSVGEVWIFSGITHFHSSFY